MIDPLDAYRAPWGARPLRGDDGSANVTASGGIAASAGPEEQQGPQVSSLSSGEFDDRLETAREAALSHFSSRMQEMLSGDDGSGNQALTAGMSRVEYAQFSERLQSAIDQQDMGRARQLVERAVDPTDGRLNRAVNKLFDETADVLRRELEQSFGDVYFAEELGERGGRARAGSGLDSPANGPADLLDKDLTQRVRERAAEQEEAATTGEAIERAAAEAADHFMTSASERFTGQGRSHLGAEAGVLSPLRSSLMEHSGTKLANAGQNHYSEDAASVTGGASAWLAGALTGDSLLAPENQRRDFLSGVRAEGPNAHNLLAEAGNVFAASMREQSSGRRLVQVERPETMPVKSLEHSTGAVAIEAHGLRAQEPAPSTNSGNPGNPGYDHERSLQEDAEARRREEARRQRGMLAYDMAAGFAGSTVAPSTFSFAV